MRNAVKGLVLGFVAGVSLLVVGCGSDDDNDAATPANVSVAGTWTGGDDFGPMTWVFSSDSTFSYDGRVGRTARGVYTVSGSTLTGFYVQNQNNDQGTFTGVVVGATMSGSYSNYGVGGNVSSFTLTRQ